MENDMENIKLELYLSELKKYRKELDEIDNNLHQKRKIADIKEAVSYIINNVQSRILYPEIRDAGELLKSRREISNLYDENFELTTMLLELSERVERIKMYAVFIAVLTIIINVGVTYVVAASAG